MLRTHTVETRAPMDQSDRPVQSSGKLCIESLIELNWYTIVIFLVLVNGNACNNSNNHRSAVTIKKKKKTDRNSERD